MKMRGPLFRLFQQIKLRWKKQGIQEGHRIQDFTLMDVAGNAHRLYDAFPKKAVMLWLTNLCEGCEEKIPFVERLREEHSEVLQIIAISVLGEDRATPHHIQEKHQIQFPLLLDPQDWVGKKLGLPHPMNACPLFNLLVINRTGRIAYRTHLSAIAEHKLEEMIKSVVKDKNN